MERLELAYQSPSSILYRFYSGAEGPYLLKVMGEGSRAMIEIAGDINEKLWQFRTVDSILRKYYGRDFVGAEYFLLDTSSIGLVRLEIVGVSADKLPRYSEAKLEAHSRIYRWLNIWEEVVTDSEFRSLNPGTKKALIIPDISLGNTIYQAPDVYRFVDW